VYTDGSTDLESGNGVDVVSLLLQSAYQSVPKLHGFFLIVAVSYTDTVICNICLLLCQICQQQVDSLVHGLAAASADIPASGAELSLPDDGATEPSLSLSDVLDAESGDALAGQAACGETDENEEKAG